VAKVKAKRIIEQSPIIQPMGITIQDADSFLKTHMCEICAISVYGREFSNLTADEQASIVANYANM
jgi:hypothetical protein